MEVQKDIQDDILRAISEIGTNGATITRIEKRVRFERHTLSKYLSFMQAHGLIYHKDYGKAKVWFINKAPLQTVLNALPEKKTYTERLLSDLLCALPLGIIVIDKDFNIQFMNERMVKEYGNLKDEKFYLAVLGRENPLKLREIINITWGKSSSTSLEVEDKRGRTLSLHATKLTHPDNGFSIILIIDDISAKRNAERLIQEQKALLEAERETLNKSAIVSEADLEGNIIYANEKFCEISKYSRKELMGENHRIINSGYHPKEFFQDMWKTISSGKMWHGIIRNRAKDGSYYWVDSAIAPVLGKSGKPIKYISIRFDITKIKRAEGRFKDKSKWQGQASKL